MTREFTNEDVVDACLKSLSALQGRWKQERVALAAISKRLWEVAEHI